MYFIDNSAVTSGNVIYSVSPFGRNADCITHNILHQTDIGSVAVYLDVYPPGNNNFKLLPGQTLVLNVTLTDYTYIPSTCAANVYMWCDGLYFTCRNTHIEMKGPESVVISQALNTNYTTLDTNLLLLSPQGPIKHDIRVIFACFDSKSHQMEIRLEVSECPLGFIYDDEERACKCNEAFFNNAHFQCSVKVGAACVSYGYWYGPVQTGNNITVNTITRCRFPDCSSASNTCPSKLLSTGASNFIVLGSHVDDQCSSGKGGLLCKGCASNFTFTFTALNCIPTASCSSWQPYVILLISLTFQILFALLLVVVVRFKLTTGTGFLYGPMLFLAVVSSLPLNYHEQFIVVNKAVSIISSIPLLNLEVFGLIPWCFFPTIGPLYNYSLRYLGPLSVLIVISIISLIARQCPKFLRRWQKSPFRAICLLLALSFWSLADTSIKILTPTLISLQINSTNVEMYLVSLQPKLKYFHSEHLIVAVPALLVFVLVIAPLVILLLFSTLLSKICNLYRIKPFLDEFQSCYKDKHRWYSSVYFTTWILVVLLQGFSIPTEFNQAIFIFLLTTNFIIQPYKHQALNVTDTIVLLDLIFLLSVMHSQSVNSAPTTVLVHILVLGPIVCIGVWFCCFISIVKSGLFHRIKRNYYKQHHHSQQQQQLQNSIDHGDSHVIQRSGVPTLEVVIDDDELREPLIGLVDNI